MLSPLYGPTLTSIHDYWKKHSLTRWTFISKVMSLLFNILPRLVIIFLPRSKGLLISWLQSPSAVILEAKKIKSVTVFTFPPSICHEVMGSDAFIFIFWTLETLNVFKSIILVKNLNWIFWGGLANFLKWLPPLFFSTLFFISHSSL